MIFYRLFRLLLSQFWQLSGCKNPVSVAPTLSVGWNGCPPVCGRSGCTIRAIKHIAAFDECFLYAVCDAVSYYYGDFSSSDFKIWTKKKRRQITLSVPKVFHNPHQQINHVHAKRERLLIYSLWCTLFVEILGTKNKSINAFSIHLKCTFQHCFLFIS